MLKSPLTSVLKDMDGPCDQLSKLYFSLNVESEIQIFNVIFHRSQGGTAQKDENFSNPRHQFFALGSSNCCDEGWKNF